MEFNLNTTYPHPLGYLDSPMQVDLFSPNGRTLIGRAERTGATPPGFPDHPVYRLPTGLQQHYPLPWGYEMLFYVFDGRVFFESRQWREAERARRHAQPLLITACAKAKSKTRADLPAWQRYDGPLYRMVRRMKRDGSWPGNLTWFILSAEYGPLLPEQIIPWYDRPMTPERATELQRFVSLILTPFLKRAASIFVDLGRTYRAALPEMPAHTIYAAGPPGQRLAQLRRWLARLKDA